MPLRCVDLYGFFTALRSFTLPAAFRAKKVAKGAAPYSVTMHLLTLQRELLQLLEKTSEDLSRLKNPPVDRAYRLPVYFQTPVTTRASPVFTALRGWRRRTSAQSYVFRYLSYRSPSHRSTVRCSRLSRQFQPNTRESHRPQTQHCRDRIDSRVECRQTAPDPQPAPAPP